jgi:hypothetical protein
MAVSEGTFVLYSRIEPPLEAGDYRFRVNQDLGADGPHGALDATALPVDELAAHLRVRSPRYSLPPDQVLSTFPPAGSEGAYGSRLPQVVIRRRTLPWERLLAPDKRGVPWLALVLIAEGEAELKLNQPVADCVTPGVQLSGVADAELGNYLQIRKSVVDRVFPTQLDVPLLAHAREVDIHDGFLAVVISNRLPLPGRAADGTEVPVKYLACLVNLEGQFDDLLPKAPDPATFTAYPVVVAETQVSLAEWDHVSMGSSPNLSGAAATAPPNAAGQAALTKVTGAPSTAPAPFQTPSTWATAPGSGVADVYTEMARSFDHAYAGGFVAGSVIELDRTIRFPVLLHWSFTSFGETTFRSLMEALQSGLLGTADEKPDPNAAGREPLEVVETGHVGLAHRIRRGDEVRSWYRGPLVANPTVDPPAGRLPLAHAADQLRIVVPDGREDISLAAAFEIGRLLALGRPSMVAALLRWRQTGYQTARRQAAWGQFAGFVDGILGSFDDDLLTARIGTLLGRGLAGALAARPEQFLGDPRALVDAGRAVPVDGAASQVLAAGFGLDSAVLRGDPVSVLGRLRQTPVVHSEFDLTRAPVTREALSSPLNRALEGLVTDAVGARFDGPVIGAGRSVRPKRKAGPAGPDALDALLDGLDADGEVTP